MGKIKRILTQLGFDGWAFLLCGVGSVAIAVLDFAQVVHLTNEDALRMIMVAIGLIMGAIAAQSGRRTAELQELRDSLGKTSVEIVRPALRTQHIRQNVIHAKRFILDTSLHVLHAKSMHPASGSDHYYYIIYERLKRKEITFRKIDTVTTKERLEFVISSLLVFEGMNYYIRYYDALPQPIPVLNVMSIDNEVFYLGAFHVSDAPAETVGEVVLRGPEISRLFEAYWNNLWYSATPLNEHKRINWDELRAIAHKVGMDEEEFDAVVSKWTDEIRRWKRRGQ
jgi:hypothetical protein